MGSVFHGAYYYWGYFTWWWGTLLASSFSSSNFLGRNFRSEIFSVRAYLFIYLFIYLFNYLFWEGSRVSEGHFPKVLRFSYFPSKLHGLRRRDFQRMISEHIICRFVLNWKPSSLFFLSQNWNQTVYVKSKHDKKI